MGKIIKINAIMDFEKVYEEIEFSFDREYIYKNEEILKLIGNNCNVYQLIPPKAIHELLSVSTYPSTDSDIGIVMVCDEEGKLKDNYEFNAIATALCMIDRRNDFIVGNCLILGTRCTNSEEMEFCAIPDNMLEKVRYFINRLLGKEKGLTEEENKNAKQCIACVKLNKENGATLPFVCPLSNHVCMCVNSTEEALEEFQNYSNAYFLEKAFNECWDTNNMPDLFEIMKDMMENDEKIREIRVDMNNSKIFNQEIIKSSIGAWDILVKKGNKDIYTYNKM